MDYLESAPASRLFGTSTAVARPQYATTTDHTAGTLKHTGNPLDLALEGDGYFVLAAEGGDFYTRQGSFRIDGSGRLIGSGGIPVAGVSGDIQLTIPDPRIDQRGVVWEGNTEVGQIRVVRVVNPDSLVKLGVGMFAGTESTELSEMDLAHVRQGFAETANVVAMNEMIKMIETVRHFEASQKLVRSYDTMLDRGINLVGEL
jgi:flagellar basal body rod protein FlgG